MLISVLSHGSLSPKMLPLKIIKGFSINASVIYLGLLCSVLFFGINVVAADEKQIENAADDKNTDNPVSQVRYRSRPVAAFRSLSKGTNSTNNSSETDGPEPSGVPFIAVHDLTSQTFEKLQENWRNLEVFIRNLQARRSQEESLRSSPSSGGGVPTTGGDRDTVRRPPYNNVYTLKYHPVVLQGEGSSSVDDVIGGNARGAAPPRTFNFNPFPYDPKGDGNKNVDMEKHTVATIYTIGICLTIMAIGSVMFILINKCDGTGGGNYIRTSATTRSVLGATRGVRQNGGNNGRNRNGRGGRSGNESSSNAANIHVSGVAESTAKVVTDLPPSYESLFPEVGPKEQDIPEVVTTNTATSSQSVINGDLSNNSQTEVSRPTRSTTSASAET